MTSLYCVTFTGADDSVKPQELLAINKEFKELNIEWAFLFAKDKYGSSRHPSKEWLNEFISLATDNILISGHFHGEILEDLFLSGIRDWGFCKENKQIWLRLNRVQLNLHSVPIKLDLILKNQKSDFYKTLDNLLLITSSNLSIDTAYRCKQYIIQMDGINDFILNYAMHLNCPNVYPLFDRSRGNGLLPANWPLPHRLWLNGYAGGLSPENIKEQLEKIQQVVSMNSNLGANDFWIDMETNVREGNAFSLPKCRLVMQGVRDWWRKSN